MNKLELIKVFSEEAGISRDEARFVVHRMFDMISDTLGQGSRVEIRGLFSFYVKEYDGYKGRNPKTGETTEVKPKRLPFFKCGKELRERVDRE